MIVLGMLVMLAVKFICFIYEGIIFLWSVEICKMSKLK